LGSPALGWQLVHTGTNGYDGQFYHYIAHDPFLERDARKSIDAPRLRYRRILVPLAAYLLAGGRSEWVDAAYRVLVWAFFLLGGYWLARLATLRNRSPAWGLAFALLPGALVSMDRLTVDIALAALCAGFVLLIATGRTGWPLYTLLVLAGLVRDTGMLLAAAFAIWLLTRKQWGRAALFSTAVLPTLAWYLFVASRTQRIPLDGKLAWPLAGPFHFALHPAPYPYAPQLTLFLHSLDLLAVCGLMLALFLPIWLVRRRGAGAPERWAMILFVVAAQLLWVWGDWREVYSCARILSPLLFFLALEWFGTSWRLGLLPLLMVLPRIAVQLSSQALHVAQGLLQPFLQPR